MRMKRTSHSSVMSSPTTPSPLVLPESILQPLVYIKADKYILVASAALFLYEFILTFPAEIRLVWKRKWSSTLFIFWFCRYTAFADSVFISLYQEFTPILSERTCKILYNVKAWSETLSIALAEVILILRTCAIEPYQPLEYIDVKSSRHSCTSLN